MSEESNKGMVDNLHGVCHDWDVGCAVRYSIKNAIYGTVYLNTRPSVEYSVWNSVRLSIFSPIFNIPIFAIKNSLRNTT